MEEPGNLMTITGLFRFDAPLERQAVRDLVVGRLLSHARFRSRVVEPPLGWPRWEIDREVDLDHHLVSVDTTPESLMELVGVLMSRPLDRSRPLWQMHLVNMGSDSALIMRVHHCLGDGVAMMRVLFSLADDLPSPVSRVRAWDTPGPRVWLDALKDLVLKVLLRPEPCTALKGPLGPRKVAAVSAPLDLAAIKRVEKKVGGTVNDVLLATLTGALRRYLAGHGSTVPGEVRVVMPVDLRSPADRRLGNQFGLAFAALSVGIAEPLARLHESRRRLDVLKRSPQSAILYGILRLAGCLPVAVEMALVRLFGSRATAVATNVHGPEQRLTMAGRPLTDLMFWVPQSGRLGLGVSIISYAGEVRVGVAADAGLIPDPQELVDEFHRAFHELEA